MVTINYDFIAIHFSDFNWDWTLVCIGEETHAYFQLIHSLEHVCRNTLYQIFVVFAVCIFWCDSNGEFITSHFAFQFTLKTCNQVIVTVQVIQRRINSRLIHHHAIFDSQLVSKTCYRVFFNFHNCSREVVS
ncbi:Uncharacterised protein [Vibrio cholerae]|nr:Uncharacterised protein [Vibrio cholerae]CSC87402.1 Uncharacterised protein [Vibrio cholerae]CSC97652.1 Uncharacterised protein [Vibrio cholerae]